METGGKMFVGPWTGYLSMDDDDEIADE